MLNNKDGKRMATSVGNLRLKGLAGAIVLAGSVAGSLVVGQQPAAANCDIPADIRISDAIVVEGTGGVFPQVSALKFTVTHNGNATAVDWTTGSGPWGLPSAAAPGDYYSSSGTLPLDGSTKTITVFVRKDSVDEPTEHMHVRLSNAKGCYANIADGYGLGRIYDDD